jgi:hypothetical protein
MPGGHWRQGKRRKFSRKDAKLGKEFFFFKPLRLSVFAGDIPSFFVRPLRNLW